ncbi:MAG: hypothetical protein R3284_10940 [Rubricoccaceae bacterium]|nr:hypothetical protein [Rubricoccaceae bacterium]
MKWTTTLVIAVAICVLGTSAASASSPFVAVYFDQNLTQEQKDCPGYGIRDTLFVAASNFDNLLGGLGFQIFYPTSVFWFADFDVLTEGDGGVIIGDTPSGISIGFPGPENFNLTRLVLKVDFFWNCDGCEYLNDPIQVCCVEGSAHPGFELVQGIGLTALVCATVPTEESTWGRVKALYGDDE